MSRKVFLLGVWLALLTLAFVLTNIEGQPPAPGAAEPALDKETLAQVRKLQEKRRDILREAVNMGSALYRGDRITVGDVVRASKRLLAAELELATTGPERITAHEKYLELTKEFVKIAQRNLRFPRAGMTRGRADVLDAQAAFLEAQIGLLKAGGKLKKD